MLHHVFRAFVALCLIAVFPCSSQGSDEIFGARYPALSPDGQTVVFSYWGDIWSAPVCGGEPARRLTDHLAFDSHPLFSPDGKEIAFVSNRSGNDDIWVMPATGGVARQVTTYSGSDSLCNWSPDGERIVFSSKRDLWSNDLYHVDSHGKEPPVQVTYKDHYNALEGLMMPDGAWIYSRGHGSWWRKHYRGTAQLDLWRISADGASEPLTEHKGNDHWPMLGPDGKTVYYVTNEDGIDNIWSLDLKSGKKRQITRHDDDGVQYPSIAPGGKVIVYEFAGHIYTVDGSGKPQIVRLTIAAEGKDNWVAKRSFYNNASDYAVSPHGKYVVVVVEGDLWAVKDPEAYKNGEKPDQDLAQALRLTASDGARELHPIFSPDNRHIAYCSDEDGDYDVYLMDLADMSVVKLTNNDIDDLVPAFDPSDENRLFYLSGNRRLVVLDIESGEESTVVETGLRYGHGGGDYAISPDGEWVAYTESQAYSQDEVMVTDTRGKLDPVNISRHNDSDNQPTWSADGRRLAYRGYRDDNSYIYVIDLLPEPETYDLEFLFEDDRPEVEEEQADDEENGEEVDDENGDEETGDESEDEDENGDEEENRVEIDFDDIYLRARRVSTQESASSPIISDDGEWVVYQARLEGGGSEIWAVKAEGGDARRLAGGSWSSKQFTNKGAKIFYRDGGTVRYMKFSDGKSKGTGSISASGEFWLDKRERWRQMYREGWRMMREQFYDPDMHGVDWDDVYLKYRPFIESIGTPEEFGLVFTELLGELNASHLGIGMAEKSFTTSGPSTGHLGLEFDPLFDGEGLRISHITYNGPADQPGIELQAGDVVTQIEGMAVGNETRWLDLLDDMSGRPVRLTIAGDPDPREVVLKATSFSAYRGLLYREWEIINEEYVAERSDNRIGYIHIRSMSGSELRKFEREFIAEQLDKDALIVDVRFNPGGLIHEQLFDLLDRHHFGYSAKRDQPLSIQPGQAFDKPSALLINARSTSDAEIFPSGWRILGLGPVIGIDTYGAVIGTGGFRLIDGTSVRMPLYGWYDIDKRNLETSGTPPDIYIDVHPDELRLGIDAQLKRAVEELLAEID